MIINEAGHCAAAQQIPSPNCDPRPEGASVRLLVIHSISLPPNSFGGDDVIRLFTNTLNIPNYPYFQAQGIRELKVSAHFFIRRDGTLIQFVSCQDRAWHAGQSQWRGYSNVNPISVGIELEGSDDTPFEDAQYNSLACLSAALLARYPIEDIVGHADVAPGRKTDPGPFFDWNRYQRLLHACQASLQRS